MRRLSSCDRHAADRWLGSFVIYGLAIVMFVRAANGKEPSTEADTQKTWIERAIGLAEASGDKTAIANAYLQDALWHVERSEYSAAITSLSHCENGAPKYFSLVTMQCVGLGEVSEAIAFSHDVADRECREKALAGIVCALSDQFQFEQAKSFLPELNGDAGVHAAFYLALKQTRAGKFDDARVTIASIQTKSNSSVEKRQNEILANIENCRLLNMRELPLAPNCSLADRYRRLLDGYWKPVFNCDDLGAAERQAAETESIVFKQATWQAIAWTYLRKGQFADAFRTKQQWETCIQQMDLPETRPWVYTLLADLELELGAKQDARNRVEQAIQSGGEAGISGILADGTNGPLLIGVFVRSGKARLVCDLLLKMPQSENFVWVSLAAFCWAHGEHRIVNELLDNPDLSKALKSTVCLGVVQAMRHSTKN